MYLFGPPDIARMQRKVDVRGLGKALLKYRKDPAVRAAAATALGELGDAEALVPLTAALQDADVGVCSAAAGALAALGDLRAVDPLLESLGRDGSSKAAEDALVSFGEGGLMLIFQRMKSAYQAAGEARQIVKQLKELKPVVDRLSWAGKKDTAQIWAAVAKSGAGAADAIRAYQQAVSVEELTLRLLRGGFRVLQGVGGVIAARMLIAFAESSDFSDVQKDALKSVEAVRGFWPLELLLECTTSKAAPVRRQALKALKDRPGQVPTGVYVRALSDDDDDVRLIAIGVLGETRPGSALEPLTAVLKTANAKAVREAALSALLRGGEPELIPSMIECLADPALAERSRIVAWLAENAGTRASAPLIGALGDKASAVRKAAATALGRLSDPQAVQPLIRALEDEIPDVREAAARALGGLSDPAAVQPLIRALDDKHLDVRLAAVRALGELMDQRGVEPLIGALGDSHRVAYAAAQALGELNDPRAVPPLIGAFDSQGGGLRAAIVSALFALGDPRAIPLSIAALCPGDHFNADGAKCAVSLLGKLGPAVTDGLLAELQLDRPYVVQALDEVGWKPDQGTHGAIYRASREEWAECARIGGPAVPVLTALLSSDKTSTRKAAAEVLVDLYNQGTLSDTQKQAILAARPQITAPHVSVKGHADSGALRYSDCPSDHHTDHATHEDAGIGVEFRV